MNMYAHSQLLYYQIVGENKVHPFLKNLKKTYIIDELNKTLS